ncbi:hypothetical protein QQF64_005975 [Cirrhinus molitorella]|uniref:Uncharacterized protein n=2 Tax=Cirrhinus molitorella TaxID=172907 RepID=A0ABR3MG10_9TELE|nr:hypothetical protein Q8A67_011011 [Cirrhinus molitorella]
MNSGLVEQVQIQLSLTLVCRTNYQSQSSSLPRPVSRANCRSLYSKHRLFTQKVYGHIISSIKYRFSRQDRKCVQYTVITQRKAVSTEVICFKVYLNDTCGVLARSRQDVWRFASEY